MALDGHGHRHSLVQHRFGWRWHFGVRFRFSFCMRLDFCLCFGFCLCIGFSLSVDLGLRLRQSLGQSVQQRGPNVARHLHRLACTGHQLTRE